MYLGVLTLLSVNTGDTEGPIYPSLVGVFFRVSTVYKRSKHLALVSMPRNLL